MKFTQTSQTIQHAEFIAFLFAFAQIFLALGLIWAVEAHIV
jgi:hypothetical protein